MCHCLCGLLPVVNNIHWCTSAAQNPHLYHLAQTSCLCQFATRCFLTSHRVNYNSCSLSSVPPKKVPRGPQRHTPSVFIYRQLLQPPVVVSLPPSEQTCSCNTLGLFALGHWRLPPSNFLWQQVASFRLCLCRLP